MKGLNGWGVDSGLERREALRLFTGNKTPPASLSSSCSSPDPQPGVSVSISAPAAVVDWHEPTLGPLDFMRCLGRYAFVACVPGAGLDPCPKLWEALLLGAVPIARRCRRESAAAGASREEDSRDGKGGVAELLHEAGFPVALVDDWGDISRERLAEWAEKYADAAMDDVLLARMTNAYWLEQCCAVR